MQRSKQNALFFLLGALMVGGLLGFSFARYGNLTDKQQQRQKSWSPREGMYRDLGFTAEQRAAWDAITDTTERRLAPIYASVRPQVDSIRRQQSEKLMNVLTPEQRLKFEERRREMRMRDSVRRAQRDSARKADKEKQ